MAICLLYKDEKDLSARQLARKLGVNKNTASRILLRINKALVEDWQRDIFIAIVCKYDTLKDNKPHNVNNSNITCTISNVID